MDEYYVRSPKAETADGPFTLEQLRELYQSDLLKPDSLYWVEGMEDFLAFSANDDLWQSICSAAGSSSPNTEEADSIVSAGEESVLEDQQDPVSRKADDLPEPENYFIKNPKTDEVSGPFSPSQLKDLVESEYINRETGIAREPGGNFSPLGEEEDLWQRIRLVQKTSLKLKKKEGPTIKKKEQPAPSKKLSKKKVAVPIPDPSGMDESGDIGRMLAAAEGKTEQTKHIQRMRKSRDRAVAVLLPGLVFSLLISVAIIVQPYWEEIFEMFRSGDYSLEFFLTNWILIFAIADLLLAIGIGLGQTGLFPLARFRFGVGIGFFLFLYYSRQEWLSLYAMTALQAGIIFSTLCTRFLTTLFFVAVALGGGGTMIWLVWF